IRGSPAHSSETHRLVVSSSRKSKRKIPMCTALHSATSATFTKSRPQRLQCRCIYVCPLNLTSRRYPSWLAKKLSCSINPLEPLVRYLLRSRGHYCTETAIL